MFILRHCEVLTNTGKDWRNWGTHTFPMMLNFTIWANKAALGCPPERNMSVCLLRTLNFYRGGQRLEMTQRPLSGEWLAGCVYPWQRKWPPAIKRSKWAIPAVSKGTTLLEKVRHKRPHAARFPSQKRNRRKNKDCLRPGLWGIWLERKHEGVFLNYGKVICGTVRLHGDIHVAKLKMYTGLIS